MKYVFLIILFLLQNTLFSQWKQYGQNILGDSIGIESGRSVAINSTGRIVAVGSHKSNSGGDQSGKVKIYQNISFDNTSLWNQLGSDIVGGSNSDQSGYTISLSGDGYTVAITHINLTSSIVKVYRLKDNNWIQIGENLSGNTGDSEFFGVSTSLSFDGNTIAVGDSKGLNSKGYVKIYNYTNSVWSQVGSTINGEEVGDESGHSLSLSDNGLILAIGAPKNDANGDKSGHVRVYKNIDNTWSQIGDDIDGLTQKDYAGYSVSLSNDGKILAIGSPFNDEGSESWCDPCTDAGKISVYENIEDSWTQIGSDIKGNYENDRLGWSISLNGNGKIITSGVPGRSNDKGGVMIFEYSSNDWSINHGLNQSSMTGTNSGDLFGYSVASNDNGNIVFSGGFNNDLSGENAGFAKAFINYDISSTVTSNNWVLIDSIYGTANPSTGIWKRVGVVTEISGDGSTFVTNHGTDNSFRIYKKNASIWKLDTIITPKTSENELMTYGFQPSFSLSYDGNTIAFATPRITNYASSGYINVYKYDGSDWIQKGETIIGSESGMGLGWDISLTRDGNRIVAGAPYNDNITNKKGLVRVFDYSSSSKKWNKFGDDIYSYGMDIARNRFGNEVDVNYNGYIISIWSSYKTELFKLKGNEWKSFDVLGENFNEDITRNLNNIALSSDGYTVVIGYQTKNECNSNGDRCKGKAQIFRYNGTSWIQLGGDVSPEIADQNFGNTVAISGSGSRIVISAPENKSSSGFGGLGIVYTYEYVSGNGLKQLKI